MFALPFLFGVLALREQDLTLNGCKCTASTFRGADKDGPGYHLCPHDVSEEDVNVSTDKLTACDEVHLKRAWNRYQALSPFSIAVVLQAQHPPHFIVALLL